MSQWSERSLRNMTGIHPDLRRVLDRAISDTPIDFVVIEGLRTLERQKQLLAKGATTTMRSRHLTGHAVDLVPLVDLDTDGKVETHEMFNWHLMRQLAVHIKAAAAKEGIKIEWGGDWKSFPDGPHWQLSYTTHP